MATTQPQADLPANPAPSTPGRRQLVGGTPDGHWDFASQDTQYATHGIHTYVAAMIPALARKLIDTYVPAGGVVLDPFCGGGAAVVEAIRSGRPAVGRDINALAVLVSRAKSTHIEAEKIQSCGDEVLAIAGDFAGPSIRFPESDYVEYWFKDYMLQPLTALRLAIDGIKEPDLKNLFQALFSGTVRSVSLTHRNEVRLRRMTPLQQESFNPDVFKVFGRYVALAKERVPSLPPGSRAKVETGDTRRLNLRNEEADSIVCSPPYGDERNGVNYTQFSKNMLAWLGYSRQELRTSKGSTLGWGRQERAVPPSPYLLHSLECLATNPTSLREAVAFYADYYEALREMARVTRNRITIVIGNRVLNQQVIDNAQVTVELMDAIGIQLETCHFRKLPTKRLPKMRAAGAAIDQEAILVFRK